MKFREGKVFGVQSLDIETQRNIFGKIILSSCFWSFFYFKKGFWSPF